MAYIYIFLTAELLKLELGPAALANKKYQEKNCFACKGCTTADVVVKQGSRLSLLLEWEHKGNIRMCTSYYTTLKVSLFRYDKTQKKIAQLALEEEEEDFIFQQALLQFLLKGQELKALSA